MKFKKSFIYIFLAIFIFNLFLMTGCRQKDETTTQKNYYNIELTYYNLTDDSDVIEPLISQYIATHPGLKIHYKKFSDFDEYERLILNEMAEGEGPDIFSMQNTWFASNYKKLTPMPENLGTVKSFEATFVDTAYKDLVRRDFAGIEKIYALPMYVDNLALYYNNDQFEDVIPTKGKPSTTWEGIKEDVALLTKEDNSLDRFEVSGIAIGRSDNISLSVDILYLLFLQYGTSFYNENMSESIFASKQNGNTPFPAKEALDFFISFANSNQKHYCWNDLVIDPNSDKKEIQAFAEGKVSMIIGYSSTYNQILDSINLLGSRGVNTISKDAIKIAPIPQLYDPKTSTEKRVTYANYFAETVSRTTKYPDIAWDFLLFITSRENLNYYFQKTHKPTSRRDIIEDQKNDPIYGVFANQTGYAESFPILNYFLYKDLFSKVISKANISGVNNSDLINIQEIINKMLPTEGLIPPAAKEVPKNE